MRIIHSVGDLKKEGEGEGAFLVTDRKGGYLCLPNKPLNDSNYQGWLSFNPVNWTLFKTIENIWLDKDVTALHNKYSHVERDSGSATERFFLYKDALIYEVFNHDGFVNVDFDFRQIFDFSDKGRMIEFYTREGGIMIVKYQKYKDESLQHLDYERYMAIKNIREYWVTGAWTEKCYEKDLIRNSRCDFFTYGTLKIKLDGDSKLLFTHAATEEEAFNRASRVWHDMSLIQDKVEKRVLELKEGSIALNSAINCLNSLTVKLNVDGRNAGVFAGYPWFFEFWARDELLSTKALMLQNNYFLVKRILMDYLGLIRRDGWLANKNVDSDLDSADAVGWLFFRFHEFLEQLGKNVHDYFTKEELDKVWTEIQHVVDAVEHYHFADGFVVNGKIETWMDTYADHDFRDGARIEIQALYLRTLRFAAFMAKLLKKEDKFSAKEEKMKKLVAKTFFNKGKLADGVVDGVVDMTQRPNIFLAYYIYPWLLTEDKWKKVFDAALKALWLPWGGLSSIDKSHELFKDTYSGEDNKSYHRGDSWYFINNIAGICMKNLDPEKYKTKIAKIGEAGEKEMLFSGFLGHLAEVSSAKKLESQGCRCQAWSAATFIELMTK